MRCSTSSASSRRTSSATTPARVIAAQVASSAPERVRSVVLSSAPFDTPEERAAWINGEVDVDEVERSADGSHVLELWRIRAGFYPRGQH